MWNDWNAVVACFGCDTMFAAAIGEFPPRYQCW